MKRHDRADSIFRRGGVRRFFKEGEEGGGGGGGAPTDWRAALPEDLRGEAMFKDVPDVATLAKIARDSKSALGNSIRIPGPTAGDKDKAEFREKLKAHVPELVDGSDENALWGRLGRPAKPEDYTLDGVDLPSGVKLTAEELRDAAKDLGLTKAQFKTFAGKTAAARAAAAKQVADNQASLRTELGQAYDQKVALAVQAAKDLGFDESVQKAITDGTMPAAQVKGFLAAADSLGTQTREVAGQRTTRPPALTPAEAQLQIAELLKNPDFHRAGPQQAGLQQKYLQLLAAAHPELAQEG